MDALIADKLFVLALKPATAPTALLLLNSGADLTAARGALLADDAKLLRALALDPDSSPLVDALCARDAEIGVANAALVTAETFLALAKPGTAAKRLAKRGKSPSRTLCQAASVAVPTGFWPQPASANTVAKIKTRRWV